MSIKAIPEKTIKIAVVQSEPEWFDLQGSVAKANKLIIEAAANGAELIGFPEVFIPGYPVWIWENPADIERNMSYIDNSLSYDSPEFQSIIETVKANPIHVVLGFSERDNDSVYIAQCIINKSGEVVLKRRKMKPTHVERAIYGDAKTSDLNSVAKLQFNNAGLVTVGGLNCWEHIQPLLTYNSATQGEQIHIASWPIIDSREGPIYSFTKSAFFDLARAYAMQTGAFYCFTSQVTSDKIFKTLPKLPEYFQRGVGCAAIFAPDGKQITEDMGESEDGLLFHEIDLNRRLLQKQLVDIVGHYSRTDMMSLNKHFNANENYFN